MSPLEIVGVLTGAVCVWLAAKENILTWPIGITNNILFSLVFWRAHVYADSCLQLFYIVIAIYGWWRWGHSESGAGAQQIRSTSQSVWLVLLLLTPLAWVAVYLMLCHWTNSDVPAVDSLISVLSLVAQYMAGRKLLQNWLVWIVVDVISVGLFIYKHLYLTSCLYLVFIAMCVAGYLRWHTQQQRALQIT